MSFTENCTVDAKKKRFLNEKTQINWKNQKSANPHWILFCHNRKMQILILFILLYCSFPEKNRFSDEIRIFDTFPKITCSWRNNLSIRGFLPWKSRKKNTKLILKQNCNDCNLPSQQFLALAETSEKSFSGPATSMVSTLSTNIIPESRSPEKITHFIWYGYLLTLNFESDI